MKRTLMCVAALLLCLSILIPADIITADAKVQFYDTATTLAIKNNIEKDAGSGYATAQGACTDGKYAYFALDKDGSVTLLKYNANTWNLKKKRSNLNLGHANDMTYNSKKDVIVVSNNKPDYNIISFVDPDTLQIKSTKKIKYKIYSICYNEKRDQYIVGISGTYDFAILDSNFKKVKRYKGYESGYLRQGADCDNNYIYFSQSGGGGNLIVIYNYKGELIDKVKINKSHEVENIFHVDDTVYVTLHYMGNFVYRIGISDMTAIEYTVHFDSNGGNGKMDDIAVTYGTDKKLSKCTFTKENYHFGGWIMRRDSADTYFGKKDPYSKNEWLKNEDIYEYVLYDDMKKVSRTAAVGDVTATAFWIRDDYRVYYDSNDGEGYMPLRTVAYDEVFTLDKSVMTKNGYVYAGWTASREYDGKVYGYKKGEDKPKWLYADDVYKEYVFADEQQVTKLTYDLGVTFKAKWELAFTISKDGAVLESYNGIDTDVVFPKGSNVSTIADKAFAQSETICSVTIPNSVDTVGSDAFVECSNLNTIYFEKSLPSVVSATSFDSPMLKKCILKTDNNDIFLGYYMGHYSYGGMLNIYKLLFQ